MAVEGAWFLLIPGLLITLFALARMFAIEALVVNPPGRAVLWSRRSLFGRKERLLRFDDLKGISIDLALVGKYGNVDSRTPTGKAFATLLTTSDERIELGYGGEREVRMLAQRISELTEMGSDWKLQQLT